MNDPGVKFVKFADVLGKEYCVNISNIKSVSKESLITKRVRPDGEERFFLSRPWSGEVLEISEQSIGTLEK